MNVRRSAAALLAATAALGLTACQEEVSKDGGAGTTQDAPSKPGQSGKGAKGGSTDKAAGSDTSAPEEQEYGGDAGSMNLGTSGWAGGIQLPVAASKGESHLTKQLGRPTNRKEGQSCALAGPQGPSLSLDYGDLNFYGEAQKGQTLKLTSWTLKGKKDGVNPPLDIQPGDPASKVAAVKGATKQDGAPFNEGPIYVRGNMQWWLNASGTKVETVLYNVVGCE